MKNDEFINHEIDDNVHDQCVEDKVTFTNSKLVMYNGIPTYMPITKIDGISFCEIYGECIPLDENGYIIHGPIHHHHKDVPHKKGFRKGHHSLLIPKKSTQNISQFSKSIRDIANQPQDVFISAEATIKTTLTINMKFANEEESYACDVEVGSDKLYLVNYVNDTKLVAFIGKAISCHKKTSMFTSPEVIINFDSSGNFSSEQHSVCIKDIRYIAEVIYDENSDIDFSMWTDPRLDIRYKVKYDEIHKEFYIVGFNDKDELLPFIHIPIRGELRDKLEKSLLYIINKPDSEYLDEDKTVNISDRYGEPDELPPKEETPPEEPIEKPENPPIEEPETPVEDNPTDEEPKEESNE